MIDADKDFPVGGHASFSALSTSSDWSSSREADKFAAKAERALHDASEAPNRLNLREVPLVGRNVELAALEGAVDRLMVTVQETDINTDDMPPPPRVISISGPAGTGKSFLAQKLRPRVLEKGGFFIKGKFDQLSRGEAYTGLATAMDELVKQIIARDFDMGIRRRVEEAVGPEDAAVLIEVFPSLAALLPGQEQSHSHGCQWAQRAKQRRFLFQQFFRAVLSSITYRDEDIASEEFVPSDEESLAMFMVMDDMQWIDRPSLDLISSLVRDCELGPFVLVTTNRPLESENGHVFLEEMKLWKSQTIEIQSYRLENLDISGVSSIVASVLDSEDEQSLLLAEIVHHKTLGNPFFVVEFLKSLVEQGLLTYSFGELKWKWDADSVHALVMSDDAVDLLTANLKGLTSEKQVVLFVAACLGLTFERTLLECVVDGLNDEDCIDRSLNDHESIDCILDSFVDSGFLGCNGEKYFFVHDLIKQATVDLVPEDDRLLVRLRVGQCILKKPSQQESFSWSNLLILGVDLCNSSLSLMGEDERTELARYNLLAGEKTMRESAFVLALRYMMAGLSCLDEGTSQQQDDEDYQVRLKLLAGAAEASYCKGDYGAMGVYADRLLSEQCPDDLERNMLFYKVLAATGQDRSEEALDIGRTMIENLGMGTFPKKPGIVRVIKEVVKTKRALRNHTKESLEALPILADKKRIAAMKIIDVLKTASYISDRNFFLVCFLKLVRWSLKYGISQYSPGGFVAYGLILNSTFGDVKAGTMFGEVALTLCGRLGIKEATAKTSTLVFAFIHHWTNDMRSCYQPIEYSHKLSMECGDTESGLHCLWYLNKMAWCTSQVSLQDLGRELQRFCGFCREYSYSSLLEAAIFIAKNLRELVGEDDLTYGWLDTPIFLQESVATSVNKRRDPAVEALYNLVSLQRSYLLGDDDEATKWADCTGEIGTKVCQGQNYVTRAHFYRGLAFLAAQRDRRKSRKNAREASYSLKLLRKWADLGNVNCVHMVSLLEAETASIAGQKEIAQELYSQSIKAATISGHIHDAGTCHERAAVFYKQTNDNSMRAHHMKLAAGCFRQWGATAKVRKLEAIR